MVLKKNICIYIYFKLNHCAVHKNLTTFQVYFNVKKRERQKTLTLQVLSNSSVSVLTSPRICFPDGTGGKGLACHCRKSHGQRRLAGHSYATEETWHTRHSRIHKNQMELRKIKEISVQKHPRNKWENISRSQGLSQEKGKEVNSEYQGNYW